MTKKKPAEITIENHTDIEHLSKFNRGDSVTVFMQINYMGEYITRADYEWIITNNTNREILSQKQRIIAPHRQNSPPIWRFQVPKEAGTYSVSFQAYYNYSAQTEKGSIFGRSEKYSTAFKVE